jgi:squalene-hopene/tetraprenyl-beta-curcumene cyclase
MNYIYGTWSVLCALNAIGFDSSHMAIRRAAAWLKEIQNHDGGWGESGESYHIDHTSHIPALSTPTQTAWALLGLMAAGDGATSEVERGVNYLLATIDSRGCWAEERFNATGFPRVFYLRYHGYPRYFPLWALARHRNLREAQAKHPTWGM